MQNVFLFGVGQHKTNNEYVEENLKKELDEIDPLKKKEFLIRLSAPFPIDTRAHT